MKAAYVLRRTSPGAAVAIVAAGVGVAPKVAAGVDIPDRAVGAGVTAAGDGVETVVGDEVAAVGSDACGPGVVVENGTAAAQPAFDRTSSIALIVIRRVAAGMRCVLMTSDRIA
jgi:hypothetical protein